MTILPDRLAPAVIVLFALLSKHGCVNSLVSKPHVEGSPGKRVAFTTFNTKHAAPLAVSRSIATRLQAVSPAVVWSAVGHVVGGATGAPIVAKAIHSWYNKIDLPPWTPPDRVFAPTWTVLYAAMGVAAGRVYQRAGPAFPITLWAFHYIMNLVWAPVFFGLKRLRLGLIINYFLLGSLAVIIPSFYQIDSLSGMLLIPYMAWVIFATALNGSVCKRNPTENGYNNAMLQSDLYKLQQEAAEYAGI